MADMLSQLLQVSSNNKDDAGDVPACLSAPEAERIIEQLQTLALADVGSPRWHSQKDWITRMNIQAHRNAATHSDEFIVELLVSLDKMQVLVHDLLVIETWKQQVLPHLQRHLALKTELSFAYMLLYHECELANLLELVLYHTHAMDTLPEDHLLELVDWAYRKLTFLASPQGHAQANQVDRTAKELLALTQEQELAEKIVETEFAAGVCAVTIIRYLCESVTRLPMGLTSRLLTSNDVPMALLALLDTPPWMRRRAGRQECYQGNSWVVVAPADRLKLSKLDAQVWLALNALLVEPRCRAKYAPDEWRRDKLLGLKRYMHELLFDQLPVLKDLQRVLDEMALGVGHDAGSAKSAALILEAVPMIRQSLLQGAGDTRALALQQARTYFSKEEADRATKAQLAAFMQQLDLMVDTVQPEIPQRPSEHAQHAPNNSAEHAAVQGPVRISCWRKAHDTGVFESWCDYSLQVDSSKPAEPVTLEKLHGLRYRLHALDPETTRPLPTQGKVVVRVGGYGSDCLNDNASGTGAQAEPLVAQALLQLPEIPVKALSGDKPPIVWVNVGLLAEDGLVLQLKLKKTDTGSERDKISGIWYTYHPVGGALTVLRSEQAAPGTANGTAATGTGGDKLVPAIGLVGMSSSPSAVMGTGKKGAHGPLVTEHIQPVASTSLKTSSCAATAATQHTSKTTAVAGSHVSTSMAVSADAVDASARAGSAAAVSRSATVPAAQPCAAAAAATFSPLKEGPPAYVVDDGSTLDLPD